VHGDTSPHDSVIVDVQFDSAGLQFTQEQLLEMQQQMMQDLEGQDGEMM